MATTDERTRTRRAVPVEPARLEDTFYCLARRRRLTLEKCLDDYLDANALARKRLACYRCPQGRENRHCYAERLPLK